MLSELEGAAFQNDSVSSWSYNLSDLFPPPGLPINTRDDIKILLLDGGIASELTARDRDNFVELFRCETSLYV